MRSTVPAPRRSLVTSVVYLLVPAQVCVSRAALWLVRSFLQPLSLCFHSCFFRFVCACVCQWSFSCLLPKLLARHTWLVLPMLTFASMCWHRDMPQQSVGLRMLTALRYCSERRLAFTFYCCLQALDVSLLFCLCARTSYVYACVCVCAGVFWLPACLSKKYLGLGRAGGSGSAPLHTSTGLHSVPLQQTERRLGLLCSS